VPYSHSELCVSRDVNGSLNPCPYVGQKTWYKSYLYVPESNSHVEKHFLDRFVRGENGEWIDVTKARRMSSHLQDAQQQAAAAKSEREAILAGEGVEETSYIDPYSGEKLVSCHGQLLPRRELLERYGASSGAKSSGNKQPFFDFDNLRFPWLFDQPDRNKQVSQHTYDWFDRQNPFIPTDQSFEILELPSMFADRVRYDRSADNSGLGMAGASDLQGQRVHYVQM